MTAFVPILLLWVLALVVCGAILLLTTVLGPHNPGAAKLAPYECGVKAEGDARAPFRLKFYLIAVLFLLFDVEAAFFFPWALVFRKSLPSHGGVLLLAMLVYLGLMALGLVYLFRKRVLEVR